VKKERGVSGGDPQPAGISLENAESKKTKKKSYVASSKEPRLLAPSLRNYLATAESKRSTLPNPVIIKELPGR